MANRGDRFQEDEVPASHSAPVFVVSMGTSGRDEIGSGMTEPAPAEVPAFALARPRFLHPKVAAQVWGSLVVLALVLAMYLLGLLGLIFWGLDVDSYTKTAAVLGGPLGLAGSVAAYLFGESRGRTS